MQPETAFWLLSATAQSAAALAGLAAILWVFFRRGWREELFTPSSFPGEVTRRRNRIWVWLLSGSSVSVLFFALALGVSLITLMLVSPGGDPVGLPITLLAGLAVGLTIFGSLIMFSFVWTAERRLFYRPYTGPPARLEPVDREDSDEN